MSSPQLWKGKEDATDDLSVFQEADWLDMLDEEDPLKNRTPDSRPSQEVQFHRQHRNNLSSAAPHKKPSRYQTISTIWVETDHGVVEAPIAATSIRENSFQLPDVIYFNVQRSSVQQRVQSKEDDHDNNHHQSDSNPDDHDRRIQETVNLIQLVKQKERNGSSTSFTAPTTTMACGHVCKPNSAKWNWIIDRKMVPQRQPSDTTNKDAVLLEQKASPPMRDKTRDCFDLYLENPAVSADLRVTEVSLSMPERASLHILPSRAQLYEPLLATSAPRKVINEWRTVSNSIFGDLGERALMVPADGAQHYLVTVCASRNDTTEKTMQSIEAVNNEETENISHSIADVVKWIDSGRNNSLGFLQIKTSHDTLFIGLQETHHSLQKPHILDGFNAEHDRQFVDNNSFLANPEKLNFHFISSTTPQSKASVDIINDSTKSLKIMRAAIAVKPIERNYTHSFVQSGDWQILQLEEFGIQLNLAMSERKISAPIAPHETVKNAVEILCTLDRNDVMQKIANTSLTFKGALVLRGTTRLDWTSETWEEAIKENPHLDASVVIEVPFSIHVTHGRVGFLAEDSSHPLPPFWLMEPYDNILDVVAGAHFPLHTSIVTSSLSEREKQRLPSNSAKGFAHYLRIFSDRNLDMQLAVDETDVVGRDSNKGASFCECFDTSIVERGPSEYIDLGDLDNLGLLLLRYRYPEPSRFKREHLSIPVTCYLRVSTLPDTGYHEIPLILYGGNIDVTGSEFSISSVSSNEFPLEAIRRENFSNWSDVSFGFENVLDWYRNTKGGYALHSVLRTPSEKRRDDVIFEQYLENLSRKRLTSGESILTPVLLKAGAIAQSEVETVSLYLTNYNPVPVTVAIDVGEVEGMSVAVGRDLASGNGGGDSLGEHLTGIISEMKISRSKKVGSGLFRGHSLEGLQRFLENDQSARHFSRKLSFRDDVSMSYSAVKNFPILKSLFWSYAEATFHRDILPERFANPGLNKCASPEHPPLYGVFKKKLAKMGFPGPVIISHDRKSLRSLDVCWDADGESEKKSDGTHTSVPPGGVARFDVSFRTPPSTALDKDITQFVGTGLSLSTDHGQAIPILISFEALQGKLDLSFIPPIQGGQSPNNFQNGVIQVPINLFSEAPDERDVSLKVPPHKIRSFEDLAHVDAFVPQNASSMIEGISLFMMSSFKRDIYLRNILSCNPWFKVFLSEKILDSKADPFLGVFIGTVSNVATCEPIFGVPQNKTLFPSFYRCALSWLKWRSDFDPRGCGTVWKSTGGASIPKVGFNEKFNLIRRAILATEWSDELYVRSSSQDTTWERGIRSGRRFNGGLVSASLIDVISKAWDALQAFSDFGLLSMVSNFRSIIEYNSTPEELSPIKSDAVPFEDTGRLLSVAIRNTTAESVLATPRLLKHSVISENAPRGPFEAPTVEFHPTLVGNVASIMLPLENPTAVPIRVRLGVAPTVSGIEDNIRSRFLGNYQNPYVQSGVLSSSPKVFAHHQWWEKGGAFFHPDHNGDMIRSHFNVTVKSGTRSHVSFVNPSFLAATAFLVGCGTRCGQRGEQQRKGAAVQTLENIVDVSPTSPIGASAAAGHALIGRDRTLTHQGNEIVRPSIKLAAGASLISDGSGPAAFGVPFSALDEVIIPPHGKMEIGPIFFRPPGRTTILGCEAAKGTKFAKECESQEFQSLIFLENSLTGLERVVMRGKALWEKIVILDPNLDEMGSIEVRNGIQTLVFHGSSQGPSQVPLAEVREIAIQNDGDVPVRIAQTFFSRSRLYQNEAEVHTMHPCELDNFRILKCPQIFPFQLLPGQNRSIFIEHIPKCRKQKDYVMLGIHVVNTFGNEDAGVFTGLQNQSPGYRRQIHAPSPATLLRKSYVMLGVGFDMSKEEFRKCVAVRQVRTVDTIIAGAGKWWETFWLVAIIFMFIVWTSRLNGDLQSLNTTNETFWGCANAPEIEFSVSEIKPPVGGKNWLAAFRCLARADPTANDLQNLGREQTRQILLVRLKETAALPPQCFTSTGVAIRERSWASNQTSLNRQRAAMVGSRASSVSNERIRTSEALFGRFNPRIAGEHGYLPSRLGWRTAASRGLIDTTSFHLPLVGLRTEKLAEYRKENPSATEEEFMEESESFNESRNETSSAFDSSYDELSDDDIIEKHVIVPVLIPSTIEAEDLRKISKEEKEKVPQSIGKDNETNISSSMDTFRVEHFVVRKDSVGLSSDSRQQETRTADPETRLPGTKTEVNNIISEDSIGQKLPEKIVRSDDGHLADGASEFVPMPAIELPSVNKQEMPTSNIGKSKRFEKAKEKPKFQYNDNMGKHTDERKEKKLSKARQQSPILKESTVDATPIGEQAQRSNKKAVSKADRVKKKKPHQTKKGSRTIANSHQFSAENREEQPDARIETPGPLMGLSACPIMKSPAILRLPPGLAPPPGFESPTSSPFHPHRLLVASSSEEAPVSMINVAADSADRDIPTRTTQNMDSSGLTRLDSLFSSGALDASPKKNPEDAGIGENVSPRADHTPYDEGERTADFDVMDFLDGILGESERDEVINRFSGVPEYVPTVMLPSNPWASEHSDHSKLSSRAAAYGIAVEDTSDRADDPMVLTLPLLTPATILSSNESRSNKEDKKQKSFYASLLNEDG